MLRKVLSVIICITLLSLPILSVNAADSENDIKIRINGVLESFDTNAVITSGRTLVPLRGIFEKLGAEVSWDPETREISAEKKGISVNLTVDSAKAYVNGKEVTLDVPAIIISGRTMVPLRFVSEAMGAIVEWDGERRCAYIYTGVRQDVLDALKKFDSLFTRDMLDWMISLYDKDSGGFYYSRSSLKPYYFAADLESTDQMFEFMVDMRIIPKEHGVTDISVMPKELRDKFAEYILSRQSDDDGYFYDPQFGKDVTDGKRERNFTKSMYTLKVLGVSPLYKTPTERIEEMKSQTADSASLPEQYENPEKFKAWLDTLPWKTYAYSAGNTVASSMTSIRAAGFEKIVQDYCTNLQNKDTGFWGDGLSYDTLNAAMKIAGVYDKNYPYPNLEKAMKSTIEVAKTCEAPTASSIWNVLMLINTAKNTYTEQNADVMKMIDDNVIEIIDIILETLKKFKKDDGGYSYLPQGSSITSQGSVVSLGLAEGDINGNALCTSKMREQAYWLYKIVPPPLLDTERDYFFDGLKNAKPIEKDEYNPEICNFTFEDIKKGSIPENFKVGKANDNVGEIYVDQDPDNFKRHCLVIDGKPGGWLTLQVPLGSSPNYKKYTVSQRFMLEESGNPAARYYIYVGGKAYEWCIDAYGAAGNFANLTYRCDDNHGMGDKIATFEIGEWHDLKIEYIPNGLKETKVIFYLDGKKILDTDKYHNGGDETKTPVKIISNMTIGKFSDTGGKLLLDDIKVTAE